MMYVGFKSPPIGVPPAAVARRDRPWSGPGRRWRQLRKLVALLAVSRYRDGLRHGVAAAIEHRHLARLPVRTVVDAGANCGQFTLLALEVFPNARVFAFEPLASPRGRLAALVAREPRVEVVPLALGRKRGRQSMYVSARDDCSSLRPATPTMTALEPDAAAVAREEVTVVPLADAISADRLDRPALLKADVQGAELDLLVGAGALLEHFDVVYLEASLCELHAGQPLMGDLVAFLRQRGFELCGVHNLVHDRTGRALQADVEFHRRHP